MRESTKDRWWRKAHARETMPAGVFMYSFLKGVGVLFGFSQAPGYTPHRAK